MHPVQTGAPPAPAAAAALTPTKWAETKRILTIAGPLAAAYLAEFAMNATMKSVVGALGYRELAAIGLASDLTAEIVLVLVGVLSVVGVLVAQAEGAEDPAKAGLAARQGALIATAMAPLAAFAVLNLDSLIAATAKEPGIEALAAPFLWPMALSMLPTLWFFALRTFVAALAKTRAILTITVIAIALNYALCTGLVHGAYGLPALGVAGAGWAKLIVSSAMFLGLLAYAYLTPDLRGYGLFRGRLRVEPRLCWEILRLGAPVAGIVILEAGLFAATSIFSNMLGAVALATYQVMLAWISVAFVTAHGLAEAGMVRTAHAAGRGDPAGARQAGLLTFAIGVLWLILLSAAPLNFPEPLVRVFLSPEDPGFAAVLEMTSRLLVLAAFFQVFDGLQVMAALALRALKDTVAPLWIGAFGYWALGVGGGYWLAFPMGWGADGLWWGMAVGLTVTGSLLAWRFAALTAPRRAAA